MTKSSDVAKLFKSFGGNAADEYREIVDHDRQEASRSRWPILEQIPLNASAPRPAAATTIQTPTSALSKAARPFHSLRVQAPPVAHVPASPDSGSLSGLFKKLAQPAGGAAVAGEPAGRFKERSSVGPQGMSSLFQRLRRP